MTHGRAEVFLTGATGTVGRAILAELLATGRFAVTTLVRSDAAALEVESLGAVAVCGAMEDSRVFEALAGRARYDFIIHAAQAHYSEFSTEEIDRLDRRAVENLERLRSDETRLMVYTSGVWVYGAMPPGSLISERSPLNPFDAAAGRAELLRLQIRRASTPWLELCPPSIVYGRNGPLRRIVEWLRASDLETIDDRTVSWSVIEAHDLGRAFVAALDRGRAGEFGLPAEAQAVGVVDFYEAIAAALGCGKIVPRSRAHWAALRSEHEVARMYASQPVDSSAFRNATGWSPGSEFRVTVRELVAGM